MKICIVGLGVVGGSYAMALTEAGYEDVFAIDKDKNTLDIAEEKKIIKKGYRNAEEIVAECDLIIMSIYPDSIVNFLKENNGNFKSGAIITDATGVKGVIVSKVEEVLREDIQFVFGHPMAGREKKGINYANSKVFTGANYIITPTARTSESAIKVVEDIAFQIGFKRVTKVTPEEHDELISFTSQLPHIIAVALINSDNEKYDTGRFIGDSYRELTRISNINGELWTELFLNNKGNLLKRIEEFENQIDIIKENLISENTDNLLEIFKKSSQRRENLE
ncbi:prephenate dehydrogenase [Inconstantimicrobium mannanitabidum]|uniref:Prephenate dehydrogenase n=1 Tax=Inconstantimicrobium mannanitabidum TaxID=1604901 RepID=A0ACB5R8A6_9CLOT|nr:prephenate dehydrogenase [Clostridium sp. TW13]GKX65429.1 prephenate dehydrogenase [Clostridium sp. TW13]